MSDLIKDLVNQLGEKSLGTVSKNEVAFTVDGLNFTAYDKDNLVGFALKGNVKGIDIYLVHDSDNYDRSNPRYSDMFEDAVHDAKHVADMLIKHKIKIEVKKIKKIFRSKDEAFVIIPNEEGKNVSYKALSVNTTNFF